MPYFAERSKLLIVFNLFGGKVRRFSELERAIPAVSRRTLAQQLRQLVKAGIVRREVYPQVPPKVEYLADWDSPCALCSTPCKSGRSVAIEYCWSPEFIGSHKIRNRECNWPGLG